MVFKRGNGKNNSDVKMIDFYNNYRDNSKNPVDYKTFSNVIKEYNDRIMNAIIYENLEFRMPFRLGYIRIQRRRLTPFEKDGKIVKQHIMPDWKKTLEYWKKIYPNKTVDEIKKIPNKKILRYLNEHTNGYSARFYWDKKISNVKNQSCYIFKATRTAKENLASYIKKTGKIEYFE